MKPSTQYKMEHKKDFGHERLEILYEDQWIIVINKPSGMLSVPYPGSRARTAQGILEEIMRKKGELNRHHKPLTVHRLDRDTSGVMMFAVTEQAQKKIMDTWHQMVTERLYRAVAENPNVTFTQKEKSSHSKNSAQTKNNFVSKQKFEELPDEGLIDDPLAFNAYNVGFVPKQGDRPNRVPGKFENSIYKKHLTGKGENLKFKTVPARTHYKIILRGKTHTLFELSLDTGKKNQIRAHLASKGYPLAGDENFRAKTNPFGRLALHARTLAFTHPFTGEEMKFEVPEPKEWNSFVENRTNIPNNSNPTDSQQHLPHHHRAN